jgi:hypothetical protein
MDPKFLVFGGSDYYPIGGLGDLQGAHSSQEEALAVATSGDLDWWHVVKVDDDGLVVTDRHRSSVSDWPISS